MSDHADDWADLQKAWHAQPADRGAYDRDRHLIQREKRRLQYEMVAELLLSLACAVIFAWWASETDGTRRWTFVVFSAAAVTTPLVTFFMRRSLWRARVDTLASHRVFLRRRARLGLTMARIGYVGGPAGVVLGFLLASQLGVRPADPTNMTAVVLACLALTAMVCWWLLEARKWRRTLQKLDSYEEHDLDAER